MEPHGPKPPPPSFPQRPAERGPPPGPYTARPSGESVDKSLGQPRVYKWGGRARKPARSSLSQVSVWLTSEAEPRSPTSGRNSARTPHGHKSATTGVGWRVLAMRGFGRKAISRTHMLRPLAWEADAIPCPDAAERQPQVRDKREGAAAEESARGGSDELPENLARGGHRSRHGAPHVPTRGPHALWEPAFWPALQPTGHALEARPTPRPTVAPHP